MIDFIDKTSEQNGTPINRENMMALQGFVASTTVFQSDGTILQTNANTGHHLWTQFQDDGSIKQVFKGTNNKYISKTTTFNANGSITEVIS